MEVTPNSPNPSTLGTVIKHITVLHTLYKNSPMKDKAFSQFYLKKILLPYREKKVTNFIIRGLLAGPHRSPLIQCSCFIGNSPKIIIVWDSSTYWYSRNYHTSLTLSRYLTHTLRVCLNIAYFAKNWKHCSKIIFKYVNSVVKPIFNEKVVEKWDLWVP